MVFLPGFKGSRLVDAQTREVLWLTAWRALPFAPAPPLALPDTRAVAADGALESLLGGLYAVYAPFLRAARLRWGTRLHVFAYDWRQDIAATAQHLATFLTQLRREHEHECGDDCAPPTLIAHSMGGLVVWAMLSRLVADEHQEDEDEERRQQLASWVARAKIVFVGTPFRALEPLLEDMTPGTAAHCGYLPAPVLATLPAAFELLAPARAACDPRVHDAAVWARHRVAVFGTTPPQSPERTEQLCAAVREMLAAADAFRTHALRADFAHTPLAHLRVAIVAGRTRATKTGLPPAFFDDASTAPLDWRTCPRTPGDGRVPHAAATAVPAGLDVRAVVDTPNDHGALLNDEDALLKALRALEG